MMRKVKIFLILLFSMSAFIFSQEKPTFYYEKTIFKPGINFEYLFRKLDTKDGKVPDLRAYIVSVQTDSEISERITISLWIGGILSSYNNMIFKKIPFSLILTKESGTIYGVLAGGGFDIKITEYDNFRFGFIGKLDYCFGLKKEWDIPKLVVSGKATGKSDWGRACIGPKIVLSISESVNPYGGIIFDYIFGKFNMDEKISTLQGSEGKKFYSKTSFGLLLGSVIAIIESFEINGGAVVYPSGENINIFIGLKYSF
ncbi:hypothetical protein NLC93_04110 [Candidatus Aminicenantes bacterium AC-335-G13]|nr:hypothetical protein [Candidatus Aminicenantes bacterium AC-335-G13]